MAARVCKNMIRAMLREKMKTATIASQEPFRQLVLQLFNYFSNTPTFWTSNDLPVNDDEVQRKPFEWYLDIIIQREEAKCAKLSQALSESQRKEAQHNGVVIPLDQLWPLKCFIREKFGTNALAEHEWDTKWDWEEQEKGSEQKKEREKEKETKTEKEKGEESEGEALRRSDAQELHRGRRLINKGLFFKRLCDMLAIELHNQSEIFDIINESEPDTTTQPSRRP